MKNYKRIIAMVAAGLACSALTSRATLTQVNNDGSVVTPIGAFTDNTDPTLSPTFLNTIFNNTPQIGHLFSYVLTGDSSNPYIGGLTFVYKVSETGSTFVDNISLDGFGGLSQVSVANEGSGVAATSASLFGGVLTFHFPDGSTGINNGGSSDYIFVYTSTTSYGGNIGNANDGATGTSGILAPVPEPSTVVAGALMLLPFGIGAIRSLRKERTA